MAEEGPLISAWSADEVKSGIRTAIGSDGASVVFGGNGTESVEKQDDINALREEVRMIRMRTLFETVNELEVKSSGRMVRQNVVWLTNKQAVTFNSQTMRKLLTALEIPNPPSLVLFIRGNMWLKAYKNAGKEALYRTIEGVNLKSIFKEGSQTEKVQKKDLKSGMRINYLHETNEFFAGVYLGENNGYLTLLLDDMVQSKSMTDKRVAKSKDDINALDRKISVFVTDVLMPIITKTNALVITNGVNQCSLCVALGKAFEALSLQRGGLIKESREDDEGNTVGRGNPRLLGIVRYNQVAAASLTPGTNMYATLCAQKR